MRIDRRIFTYIQHAQLYLGFLGVLSIVAALLILLQASSITEIIDRVFLAHQGLQQVTDPVLLLLVVLAVRTTLPWITEVLANFVSTRAKSTLRNRLFSHIQQLGPMYTRGERSGELVNTVTEGVEALDAYFSQVLPQICATAIIPLIVLIAVFRADLLSGIILLITLPLLPLFMILIGIQANKATQRRWQQLSTLSAHFLDVLQGATTLKLFGRNRAQEETIRLISERFGNTTMEVLRIAFLSSLVMEMGATLSTAIVAVEIGLRVLYGQMPFAPAFFVLLLAPEYYQPLRALGPQFHASMNSAAGAKRIFDILDTPLSQSVIELQKVEHEKPKAEHSLEFQHVSYTYNATEKAAQLALCDVSFGIQRGQKVALVGQSGAGKTTIANLLLRFIDPQEGMICTDDRALTTFSAQEWRKLVSWQPQQPYLFNTTVAENIRMGRADAGMEEVVQAAQQASIHEFIQTLPQGYETLIGERGTRLSGGQIQRLSLARAFLKDAPILLLDEATSTLDAETEATIIESLKRLMEGRMALIIAHRLHTIREADKILVLHEGRLVAAGTHAELLQQSEVYQELVQAYADERVEV